MREVCISGFASLSRDFANEMPEHIELWAMNEAHIFLKRKATRWFQLHPKSWRASPVGQKAYVTNAICTTCNWAENASPEKQDQVKAVYQKAQIHATKNPEHEVRFGTVRVRKNGYGRAPYHMKFLKTCGVPVYQMKVDPRIPTSVKYPYDEIVERYGRVWLNGKKRPYLTSTAAYMLALALYEHENGNTIDRIHLAGIELAIGTEYFHQRPCVEYWIARLEQAGVEYVPSPYGSGLLQGPIYAIEHNEPLHPESMQTMHFAAAEDSPVVAIMEDEDGNPVGF